MKISLEQYKQMPETICVKGVELDKVFIDLSSGQWYNYLCVELDSKNIEYYLKNFNIAYL